MTTYVIRNGELVDKSTLLDDRGRAIYYISDIMDPTRHMADGKLYTSKSEFRKTTRAHGCIEVGDQAGFGRRRAPLKLDKAQRVENIKRSIYELKNGRR